MNADRLLTPPEAARRLGLGADTVRLLMDCGELEAWRVNGRRRTSLTAIANYLSRNRVTPNGRPAAKRVRSQASRHAAAELDAMFGQRKKATA
jgi:excisionase family DNA binding protein